MPNTAIIIPTKNEQNYLPNLLKSLENQTYKDFVIIVADANSTDNTPQIAKQFGAILVEGGLPFEGRNNGAKKAIELGAKLLIFIDADIILPTADFLQKAISEINSKNLDIAGTLQKPYIFEKGKIKVSKNLGYNLIYGSANLAMRILQHTRKPMFQVCMFAKSEVHQKIGGFKPLEYGEDSQYVQDAVQQGYKFAILKTVPKVLISPRRFQKKGFFKSGVPYFLINFMLGRKFTVEKSPKKYFD